jgi:hypothetical protein
MPTARQSVRLDQDRHQPSRLRGPSRDTPARQRRLWNKTNERGERTIWLEPLVLNHLRAMRGPGESYSNVILRLVAAEG